MMNEESLLDFIRNMRSFDIDTGDRYEVRGSGETYEVWDNYLLTSVPDYPNEHIGYYIRLAQELNANERTIQREYDKKTRGALH
jgi:hypothetical protein